MWKHFPAVAPTVHGRLSGRERFSSEISPFPTPAPSHLAPEPGDKKAQAEETLICSKNKGSQAGRQNLRPGEAERSPLCRASPWRTPQSPRPRPRPATCGGLGGRAEPHSTSGVNFPPGWPSVSLRATTQGWPACPPDFDPGPSPSQQRTSPWELIHRLTTRTLTNPGPALGWWPPGAVRDPCSCYRPARPSFLLALLPQITAP